MLLDGHRSTHFNNSIYVYAKQSDVESMSKEEHKKENEVNIVVHCVACTVYATTQRNTPLLGFNAFVWVFLYGIYGVVWLSLYWCGATEMWIIFVFVVLVGFIQQKGKCSMCSNIEKIRQCENRCEAVEWNEKKERKKI